MNDLLRQVRLARRRLTLMYFFRLAFWSLLVALVVAGLAVAIRKVWFLPADGWWWSLGWSIGSVSLAVLVSLAVAWWKSRRMLDAAMEVDDRLGLKERVSSCLALSDEDRETQIGRALIEDARRRVCQADVAGAFHLRPSRRVLVPFGLAVALVMVTMMDDALPPAPPAASAAPAVVSQQVKKSAQTLKQKIAERQKQASEEGLKEAGELFNKLEKGIDRLSQRDDVDKKKALVQLNDLAQQINQRKQQLGDRDMLRQQFERLKDLSRGPADRMLDAVKQGDFQAALDELGRLKDRIENNALSEQEKQQLAQQLKQMQSKLEELADAHQQAKQEIEKQIQQKMAQGDREAAAKLQQQLDQLNQQNRQMEMIQQMAQQLGKCSQSLQDGQLNEAAAQLAQLSEQLDEMKAQISELQMLEGALDQIAQAKLSMG